MTIWMSVSHDLKGAQYTGQEVYHFEHIEETIQLFHP